MRIEQHRTALIVVDLQNDFMPNGNLAVENADQIIPIINQLAVKFNHVILTQDWHPEHHISFACNQSVNGQPAQPFQTIQVSYGQQILWPKHCVQGSHGADFHQDLSIPHASLIIRKGCNPAIDSYSAFIEADTKSTTGLAGYLREKGIDCVFITGVATDFCVAWTALDAQKLGFKTYVIEDACRAIDTNGSLNQAWKNLQSVGIERVFSHQL